ncbi:STAS/SEC14 domain-containing protein [Polyangium aurulentum]|uniref:STAS/SEC14 domain-containing protein n=1 Tax=Polyangium aurulentum TaxID=2567896 RepID=UPI0010AED523|nr:STAS/SEC14 domain-containing protein [Polyangium aurulentum]UQA56900.1 STAS/SEC14 domain-containing protein [Polyangium aurulentum]
MPLFDATPIEKKSGRHTVRFEPPSLVCFILRGDVSTRDVEVFYAFTEEHARGRSALFALNDLTELGDVLGAARRLGLSGTAKIPFRGLAYFGGSFRANVLTRLTLRALRLITSVTDNPIGFFDTEAEARAWLAERAREVEASPERRSAAGDQGG